MTISNKVTESKPVMVWLDGTLVDGDVASISPFDHGLLTGDGVFETLISYGGQPFAVTRHWERLKRSAEGLMLSIPDKDTASDAILDVLRANDLQEARIRITITGGIAPLGSEKGKDGGTYLVAATSLPPVAGEAKVITVPFRRNEFGALAGLKTTSYGENVRALAMAKAVGGNEAIFANTAGMLCEGTGTNVFLVKAGRLVTPSLASGCLAGVTRSVVMDICRAEGIGIEEVEFPLETLEIAEEAFLTSTIREVQPIAEVDGRRISRCPGPLSEKLAKAFKDFVANNIDP